jgi:hypothetical protein
MNSHSGVINRCIRPLANKKEDHCSKRVNMYRMDLNMIFKGQTKSSEASHHVALLAKQLKKLGLTKLNSKQ